MKFLYFFLQNLKLTDSPRFGRKDSTHLEELATIRFDGFRLYVICHLILALLHFIASDVQSSAQDCRLP